MPFLSVVITARQRNVLLGQCIASVLSQRIRDVEVIVLDRSKDSDHRIAEKPARYLHLGPVPRYVALNTGLDEATGDYVLLLDGNDLCAEGALRALKRTALKFDADMVLGEGLILDGDETRPEPDSAALARVAGFDRFDGRLLRSTGLRTRIMRRETARASGVRFGDFGRYTEMAFTMTLAYSCKRIVTVQAPVSVSRPLTLDEVAASAAGSSLAVVEQCWNAFQSFDSVALERIAAMFPNELDADGMPTSHAASRYRNLLIGREIVELLTIYRDRAWFSEEEMLRAVAAHVSESSAVLQFNTWDQITRDFPELTVSDLPASRADLARQPLISALAFAAPEDAAALDALIDSLLAQGFPRIEIVVPAVVAPMLTPEHRSLECLVAADGTAPEEFYATAAAACRARTLLVTRAGLLYDPSALREAYTEMRKVRCDLVLWGNAPEFGRVLIDAGSMDVLADGEPPFSAGAVTRLAKNGYVLRLGANRVTVPGASGARSADAQKGGKHSTKRRKRRMLQVLKSGVKAALSRKNIRLWTYEFARRTIPNLPLQRKVFFYSPRSAGELKDNARYVYDALSGARKVAFTALPPHRFREELTARYHMATARVIVVDDYDTRYLRHMQLRPGQHAIQLWHACGAFKHFGMDSFTNRHDFEIETHRHYDTIITSADDIRRYYASAFAADIDNVRALGVPRTDFFFDEAAKQATRAAVLSAHPELEGKQVILYAPTFREHLGNRTEFISGIDFGALSARLREGQVLAIRRHPVITEPLLGEATYPNVVEIEDVTTNDLMLVADYLVTDYSTVIFDFSLLKKGFCLYCPDLGHYNRGFYFNFPDDIPVPFFRDPDSLIEHLASGEFGGNQRALARFAETQMGACDGSSSKRVAKLIRHYLRT